MLRGAIGRSVVAGAVAVAAVGGLGSTAFANGGGANQPKLVADYADATWTGADFTVRIAPGVEVRNGVTTNFLEASIEGSRCVAVDDRTYRITADLDATQSGYLAGVSVDSRSGSAEVDRVQQFTGTITLQPYEDGACTVPTGSPQVVENPDLLIEAEWTNHPGATPVVYSGNDCGGTGTCYYVDADATGTIALPGVDGSDAPLGGSVSGFLFNGQYPL